MDTNKEAPGIDRERIPETITFRTADRMTYGALGYDGNELMAFISGYDLEIKFNLRLINSLADAEACADALAQVFYDALMEQLLCNEKAGFVNLRDTNPLLFQKRKEETMSDKIANTQDRPEEKPLTEQELQFCNLYVNGGLEYAGRPKNALWRYSVRIR